MQCLNCSHQNDGGKFCVKCGTRLGEGADQQVAASIDEPAASQPSQGQPAANYSQQQASKLPNQHVENAKKISKLYIGYFMQGLKNPTATAQGVHGEQFINGIITMVLFAISIPLTLFFGWSTIIEKASLKIVEGFFGWTKVGTHLVASNAESSVPPEFMDLFFKNALFCILFISVVAGSVLLAVKLGKADVTFKDVFARFGTFLIVPTFLLIASLILAIINVNLFLYVFAFGILSIFFVIALTISSFTQNQIAGLDSVYGTLISYVVTAVVVVLLSQSLIEFISPDIENVLRNSLADAIEEAFDSFW